MRFHHLSKQNLPGDGWKGVYHDEHLMDEVFLHEDDAIAMVSLGPPCTLHKPETFCIRCLSRLEEAAKAARRALDPEAPPIIKELEGTDALPAYLALVNPISEQAYVMRLERPLQFAATKFIFTSKKKEHRFEWPIQVLDYNTEANVCDAAYMRAFRLRLGDGVPEDYTKRLWESRFSLLIDGEYMVRDRPLKELLGQKEILLPRPVPKKGCLFGAHRVGEPGKDGKPEVDSEGWIGYMLPNGTKIQATLDQIPAGGGLVQLELGWVLGIYSTKEKPSEKLNS